MSFDAGVEDAWISAHPTEYGVLFDDGLQRLYLPNLTIDGLALTAIRRATVLSSETAAERARKAIVYNVVNGLIAAIYEGDIRDVSPLLETKSPAFLDNVARNTSRIIWQWGKACARNGVESPFADMNDTRQDERDLTYAPLIIMTATALAAVVDKRPPRAGSKTLLPEWATLGVLHYGPGFTIDFMLGRNTREVLGDLASDTNKRLPGWKRNNLLSYSPQVLTDTLEAIAGNLDVADMDKVAKILGWSLEKTKTRFTPTHITNVAANRPRIPLVDTIKRIGYLYDNVLTFSNLSRNLDIGVDEAKQLVGSAIVKEVVFSSPDADPIVRLQEIYEFARSLSTDFSISLPLAVWMATYIPGKAVARAQQAEQEQKDRPAGVSESFWRFVVIKFPKKGDPRRNKLLVNANSYWNFLQNYGQEHPSRHPISIDAAESGDKDPLQADSSWAPEQILFGEEATSVLRDRVQALFTKAGLSNKERGILLEFFEDADAEPDDSVNLLLQKVRQVSEQ